MSGITVTEGTQTNVATDVVGTTNYQKVKMNVGGAGTDTAWLGTSLADNVANPTPPPVGAFGMNWDTTQWQRARGGLGDGASAGGMANVLPMVFNQSTHDRLRGDINGLLAYGQHPGRFGTTVTTGTTTLGTILAGAGAGTFTYITDIIISAGTTTTLVIGNGGTASPLIGTLSFAANGGMVSNFQTPIRLGTNGTLVYQQSVGGALSITVNGFKSTV